MISFRKFIEQEAAPPAGMPSSPESPGGEENKTDKDHFRMMKITMGIEDDAFDASIGSDTKLAYINKKFNGVWVKPPIPITFEPDPVSKGRYLVKFLLTQMQPKSFYYRTERDGKKVYRTYKGTLEDQEESMSEEQLTKILAHAYQQIAPTAGSGMPPLGGM